ncbi:MAG: Flp pilus assembly complex ATPase component TadA [Lachnospiraceae bacterium]|nr:Flp pilus assembly complex ATPase component TadA [Lachnospiraceae bacterium]
MKKVHFSHILTKSRDVLTRLVLHLNCEGCRKDAHPRHEGSLSTGHANSAYDMLSRLETMVLQGSDIPLYAVRKQIAAAIDVFVQLSRRSDGSRGVAQICENDGMKDGDIVLRPVFEGEKEGNREVVLRYCGGSKIWNGGEC